jgi:hypothetical protein
MASHQSKKSAMFRELRGAGRFKRREQRSDSASSEPS